MDTLLLIVIGVPGLFIVGWTFWVLAQVFFGLIAINFAGPMLFWESKNPIKWVGLVVWLLGIWFAWEYNTNSTEYACPEGMSNCSWNQQIPVSVSWSDLAFNMFLALALITVIAGITVAVLIDKTEDYYKQQQAKDRSKEK